MNLAKAKRLHALRLRIESVKASALAATEQQRRRAESEEQHAIAARDELRRGAPSETSAGDLRARTLMAERATGRIETLSEVRAEAVRTRDEARDTLAEATQDTARAERLRDREAAKVDARVAREEQTASDEAGARIVHGRRDHG